jgi:hypothetical protein
VLHRIERWPYARRCTNRATQQVELPDGMTTTAWVCDECADRVAKQKALG